MEESSLLLKVSITKNNWEAFLDSEVMNVSNFNDWKAWFKEEKRIHCDDTDKFVDDYFYKYEGKVKDNLEWMNIEYDEEKEILILSNLFYHVNWEPTLGEIAVLRGISKFISLDTKNNFLVIYPYWWGDRGQVGKWVDMYIELNNKESFLVSKLNKQNVDLTTQYFDSKDDEWYKNCHMAIYPEKYDNN